MVAAFIEALIAIALLVFFISKYVNIKALSPGKNIWIALESKFEFCNTWKFKGLIIFAMLGFVAQCGNQLEADKYGIDSSKLTEYRTDAKRYNLSIEEYQNELDNSKKLNFNKFDDYIKAKSAGFQDSQSWAEGKQLRVNTFSEYQDEIQKMKSRGFSNVNDYIVQLNRDAEALAAKEAAKREATEKAEAAAQAAKQAKASSAASWRSGDGRSESDWISLCRRHQAARSECAVSATLGSCVEIKLGPEPAVMANMYCNDGVPNFGLMGRR